MDLGLTTQLMDSIGEVQQSMNARQQTNLVVIDFSKLKAFDTVQYLTRDCLTSWNFMV